MEFIEASAFTKHIYDYLSEEEFLGLQSFLLQYPEAGKVVPGSGGVRKLRWAVADEASGVACESFTISADSMTRSGC